MLAIPHGKGKGKGIVFGLYINIVWLDSKTYTSSLWVKVEEIELIKGVCLKRSHNLAKARYV